MLNAELGFKIFRDANNAGATPSPSKFNLLLTGKVPTLPQDENSTPLTKDSFSDEIGEQAFIPSPEDILSKIQSGEFSPVNTFRKQLGPEEIKKLGIKLGTTPGMYDIVGQTGEKVTILAMENAAFIMSPNHPLVHDLQGAMADVLIQNSRAKQPIISAKGINDALKDAGLPVLKNKSPREILEFGADLMLGYEKFLQAQVGVLKAQLRLKQLAAAGDSLDVLREDIRKSGWEMMFTSPVRKQNAVIMLRLGFLAAADELVDNKTLTTLTAVTAIDKGLEQLKVTEAKDWADGVTNIAAVSLGNLGKGVKDIVDNILIQPGGKISSEAVKFLTNLTFGQNAYDEGLVKTALEKLGIGADKLDQIAKRLGTSVGGLIYGFWSSVRGKDVEKTNDTPTPSRVSHFVKPWNED